VDSTGTNAKCVGPVYTGAGSADFGKGFVSPNGRIVGGGTYSESFTPVNSGVYRTSYSYLDTTAKHGGIVPTNLSTICPTLLSTGACALPAGLADGVYKDDS